MTNHRPAVCAAEAALDALPEIVRRVEALVHVEGVPPEHAARRLRLPVADVLRHLAAARAARLSLAQAATARHVQLPSADDVLVDEMVDEMDRDDRGRGRPTNVTRGLPPPLTPGERNRAWRQARGIVSLEVPGVAAARFRAVRGATGMTTEALLLAALDAFEASQRAAKPHS